MDSIPLDQKMQKNSHFNLDTSAKMDQFILSMPFDKWYNIGDDLTKLEVVKNYIDLNCLWPAYLTLSEDMKSFIKRKI